MQFFGNLVITYFPETKYLFQKKNWEVEREKVLLLQRRQLIFLDYDFESRNKNVDVLAGNNDTAGI